MTDQALEPRTYQGYESISSAERFEVSISIKAEFAAPKRSESSTAPSGARTVKLKELRHLLKVDEFQRLERTLYQYLRLNGNEKLAEHREKAEQTSTLTSPNDGLNLTGREREVMQLIIKGYRSQEMSDLLEISIHTVTAHIKNLYRKLKVGSRSEAIFEALQQGLVEP